MRILQLSLTDYIPLTDSDITHLTVDYTSDAQVALGSNGSGKSSYQRQLSLFPYPKSIFGKKGAKSITVEVNGEHFKLDSDYKKSSSPHSFYNVETGENLNEGGTTEIQRELIKDHLGITSFVDDLIMNRINFPKMITSKRKEFLMAHNPDQIGFVLTMAKQKASEIRACKNNLNRLNSRKIILEQDLLSPEDQEALILEKAQISEALGKYQQLIMDIEIGLRSIGSVTKPVYDPKAILYSVRNIRYALVSLSHISRDDYTRQQHKDHLIGDIATQKHQVVSATEQLEKLVEELNDMEVRYKEIAPDGDLHAIEATVSRLETDRDRTKTSDPSYSGNKDDLVSLYDQLETIRTKLFIFTSCDIPLYTRKKRAHRERMLDLVGYRKNSFEMTLNDLRTQYAELSKRHTVSPKDIPEEKCSKDKCPLYAHFMEGYQTTEHRRQEIQRKAQRIKQRLGRIDFYLEHLNRYFENSRQYHEAIAWLTDQAQINPLLHRALRSTDLLTTLKTNPNRIVNMLKESYDHIDQWFRYKSILSDLETAYALRSRLMGAQNEDTVKLVVGIENTKKSITKLHDDIDTASVKRGRLQKDLDDIALYDSLKKSILDIQKIHVTNLNLLADGHELDRLTFLKREVEEMRAQAFLRMSEVERVLRAQSGLQERYQEEVVSQISIIETELADLEQIEKALLAIPKESTIWFVNTIFERANLIIGSIWTIPFEIALLKEDDPLDYSFQVTGDNQSIREMSECSEGQMEILSLAINLALRIELDHLYLPLCLDEPARTFDEEHRHRMISFLRMLLDDKLISQLFVISHHANLHEGLKDSETFVVRDDNITVPPVYNKHVVLR